MPETTETVVCALGLVVGLAGIIAVTIVLKSRRPVSVPGCRGPCESSRCGRGGGHSGKERRAMGGDVLLPRACCQAPALERRRGRCLRAAGRETAGRGGSSRSPGAGRV